MQQAVEVKRPVLRWHGGKWKLAPWIIESLPPHRVYVEPFGGAGSVLMRKPRSYAEVYNDLDSEVVNLFRVLRNREQAEHLRRALLLTPFAREEFLESYEPTADPLEQARRLVIRCFMGFGSNAHNSLVRSGFRANSNRSGTTPARDWVNWPEKMPCIVERLQGVVIENRDAAEVIAHHDTPETLFYVDPPYPFGTRVGVKSGKKCYRHEMTDADHVALARVLRDVEGMVVLSGYPCDLYDRELYPDWKRCERKAYADGARERIEVLWMNDAAMNAITASEEMPSLFATNQRTKGSNTEEGGMNLKGTIAEIAAREAARVATPIAMDAGAEAFCKDIPLDWLEKLLARHHDEYGEFAYAACAKDIKGRLVKQAQKKHFSKQVTA